MFPPGFVVAFFLDTNSGHSPPLRKQYVVFEGLRVIVFVASLILFATTFDSKEIQQIGAPLLASYYAVRGLEAVSQLYRIRLHTKAPYLAPLWYRLSSFVFQCVPFGLTIWVVTLWSQLCSEQDISGCRLNATVVLVHLLFSRVSWFLFMLAIAALVTLGLYLGLAVRALVRRCRQPSPASIDGYRPINDSVEPRRPDPVEMEQDEIERISSDRLLFNVTMDRLR